MSILKINLVVHQVVYTKISIASMILHVIRWGNPLRETSVFPLVKCFLQKEVLSGLKGSLLNLDYLK